MALVHIKPILPKFIIISIFEYDSTKDFLHKRFNSKHEKAYELKKKGWFVYEWVIMPKRPKNLRNKL